MRFKSWIAAAALLIASPAFATHTSDRALYLTDVKTAAGTSIFYFPTALPTASRVCTFNSDGEITSSTVTTTTLGFLDATSSIQTQLNGKQSTLTIGNLTDAGTAGLVVTGGTGAVIGSGTSLAQHVADTTHNGYLSSTDWNTFNGKQASGNYITALTSDVTASGPGSVAATIASNAVTSAKFRQSVGLSVVGNSSNSTANVGDITAVSDKQVLRRAGTLLGFGAIDLSSSNAVTGTLANANTTASASTGASTIVARDANGVAELQVKNPINTQSGTSYTLVAGDSGKLVRFTSSSSITLTVPASLGAEFNCLVEQAGSGQITFTASGTAIHNAHSFTKTFGQWSIVTLVAESADVFVTSGDMQ